MQPLQKNATLIVLEGIDGSGKTSVGARIADFLRSFGHSVSWHPNQSLLPVRQAMNEIARESGFRDRFHMFGANTAQLMSSLLKYREMLALQDELARPNHIIVKDRYVYSWYAYASVFETTNEPLLRRLFDLFPRPDVTFLLEVTPEVAHDRIVRRGIDSDSMAYLYRATNAYRNLTEYESVFESVDADRPAEVVLDELCARTLAACPWIREGSQRPDAHAAP